MIPRTMIPQERELVMQIRTFIALILGLASTLIAPPSAQAADSDSGATAYRQGIHVVRPGDTLENITARYLGSSKRWRENWKLNQETLGDPHRLQPGDRLHVLIEEVPVDGALVAMLSNKVENRLLPLKWKDAELQDLLQPNDNLRTSKASSASLLFTDDTMLVISELSLVIIGKATQTGQEVAKALIEIDEGQADFSRVPGSTGDLGLGIEIHIGDASMVPKVGPDGKLEARARNAGNAAQVMIYSGESQLSAAGQSIQVPEGMGSAASGGKPPSPPEKLLPAATHLVPQEASEWAHRRPEMRWQPVTGAQSYTVEVCRDRNCQSLIARATGIDAPPWSPDEDLPLGDLFWRVTATSPSGLDGYPSEEILFKRVDRPHDADAPTVGFRFEGPRANIDEDVIVGPGFELKIEPEDMGSGIESWYPIIDGEHKAAADLAGPWTTGEHQVVIVATDKAGNTRTSDPIELVYDDVAPRFVLGLQSVGEPVARDLVERFSELDGPSATQRGRQVLSVAGRNWWLDSDFTQVILRPTSGSLRLDGADQKLNKQRGLWLLAEDDICQIIDTVRYELEERSLGGRKATAVLIVEAIDCVGNRSRIAMPLSPSR